MKIYLLSCAMTLMAVSLLVSCNKDDDEDTGNSQSGTYRYFQPCLQWESNVAGVRTYMKTLKGWSEAPDIDPEDNQIDFVYKDSRALMTYTFKDGGLIGSNLTYFQCNDAFDNFMNDVTKEFGLTWSALQSYQGKEWYSSSITSMSSNISIGKSSLQGGYMYVDFSYIEYV